MSVIVTESPEAAHARRKTAFEKQLHASGHRSWAAAYFRKSELEVMPKEDLKKSPELEVELDRLNVLGVAYMAFTCGVDR